MRRLWLLVVVVLAVGCLPRPTPVPRAVYRMGVPMVMAERGEVWKHAPRYRLGVAAAYAGRDEESVRRLAELGVFSLDHWSASLTTARAAAKVGMVYYPRLHIIARFSAEDRDGVQGEATPDLLECVPADSALQSVRALAREFPGMEWSLFNEPDNLDLTAGSGCWDPTAGGEGYRGYGGDPAMTGPRFAYRQTAMVVRYWVEEIRAADPTARFNCCGELNGAWAGYVRGVADAYRELYGERLPVEAVSLHIYRVNDWDLEDYQSMLADAVANVDQHPDLRGLPIHLNEGINLSLDVKNAPRDAELLYRWYDWLGASPYAERVRSTAWWVDFISYETDKKREAGTRLFDGKDIAKATLSVVGKKWRDYSCHWIDGELDTQPTVCPLWWWESY